MAEQEQDPIVFEKGTHQHIRDGVVVTLVIPEDVRLSQIAPALAAMAEDGEGGEADAA